MVVSLLKNRAGTRESILCGECSFNLQDYPQSFKLLSRAAKDADYRNRKKGNVEEVLFNCAMYSLSVMYRIGVNGASPNLEAAVEVLNNAIDGVTDEELKNLARKELQHYQRKLFGGWKYV